MLEHPGQKGFDSFFFGIPQKVHIECKTVLAGCFFELEFIYVTSLTLWRIIINAVIDENT
mgnify:CR=1 FL=1